MFCKLEAYSYIPESLETLKKSGILSIEPSHYVDLTFREYVAMQKSIHMAKRLLKAKMAIPASARWITVHPNGDESSGQPVLIQDTGNGTAHVIAGASGRLNGLKLNKIRSKEEYRQAVENKREKEKLEKLQKQTEEQQAISQMSPDERRAYKDSKKAAKEIQAEREIEAKKKKAAAESEFIGYMAGQLGWDMVDYDEETKDQINKIRKQIDEAKVKGDKDEEKWFRGELGIAIKARERAKKSQRANLLAAAKEQVRNIQRELITDPSLNEQIHAILGEDSGARQLIRKENPDTSVGFKKDYENIAKEKGLSPEELERERKKLFSERINEIAAENPGLAQMITKGIETNKRINDAKNQIYIEEEAPTKPIQEIDQKAGMLKKYLDMKKVLADFEEKKPTQINLDGTEDDAAESADDIVYGRGVSLAYTEILDADIQDEVEKITTERQAALHSSLLQTINDNPGGSGKWIANGNYAGLNSISLAAMRAEGLDRDVVDILGVGASAKLLAMTARKNMSPEAYQDFVEAMEKYHQATNETIARDALERGKELLARAESIQAEIDANPNDLAVLSELNATRLSYLDEANRIVGQALGSLEAAAAMVVELKNKNEPGAIDVSLGDIFSEEAIIRMHALGLSEEDYKISTINTTKVVTIIKPEKLLAYGDPEDLRMEQEVESIKAGLKDEPGWLPSGIVRRTTESFEDPGPNTEYAADSVENQSLGDTAEEITQTEEAVHRALGELPEGSFAFKNVADLSPEEQTDLRRYWENHLYQGSYAERFSTRDMQNGKPISRQAAWMQYVNGSFGGNKVAAFEAIRQDLIENHSTEDMFGMTETPPLAKVIPGKWETYRVLDGARALFQEIEDIRNPETVIDQEAAAKEADKLEKQLPEKLTELYESQMRDHYLSFMSGISESQFDSGAERQEQTPWAEYVRMHGDVKRAQASVLDSIRGDFSNRFVKNYGRVAQKKLRVKTEKIRNWQDHVLGMLDKDTRDSVINKVQAELASAGAKVANRVNGKFATGAWKEKALQYLEEKKLADKAQGNLFGETETKQDDKTEIPSLGERVNTQLASIIPQIAINQHRGQKYVVSRGMNTAGERQRAVKMFETVKRMNLTFGTGKGKTILSIASFTDLKSKGKVKRGLYAVPSVVQEQFGNEINVFCEPGKYHVESDSTLNQAERIRALKNNNYDMVVYTHQGLRDDLVHIMATQNGLNDNVMRDKFNAMSPRERRDALKNALDSEGIHFDMLTVDESHYTTNRKGKEDTTLSNVMDALNQNVEYFMNQSATPVKNDASEAFDMLRKVAPERFNNRAAYLKKYGVDSQFSRRSLQRLINRYNYASPTVTGTQKTYNRDNVSLSPEQQTAYDRVNAMFKRASLAQREGRVDVEAMEYLSPNSFKNIPSGKREATAKQLQDSVGVIKEEALNRVVNQFDWHHNAKIDKVFDIVASQVYTVDNPKTASKAGDKKPGVIFAHNLSTIENLRKGLTEKGLRVGIIQGAMNGAEKEKVKVGFNPPNPSDRIYDVLLCSDAGATGLNLQNAGYLINFDLPQTSWVKQQREGRIDRPGQAHDAIEYHDIVSETDTERARWNRIQRKKALGSIFEEDPGDLDDTGLASMIANVRQDRYNQGIEKERAA